MPAVFSSQTMTDARTMEICSQAMYAMFATDTDRVAGGSPVGRLCYLHGMPEQKWREMLDDIDRVASGNLFSYATVAIHGANGDR